MWKGLLAAVLLALTLAAPAQAAPRLVVGIGDQKSELFIDQRLSWLGVKHARLVVPWYVGTGVNQAELEYA